MWISRRDWKELLNVLEEANGIARARLRVETSMLVLAHEQVELDKQILAELIGPQPPTKPIVALQWKLGTSVPK